MTKKILIALAFIIANQSIIAQFVGGDGNGFATSVLPSPNACMSFGGLQAGDGFAYNNTNSNCIMFAGATTNDGYGVGASPNVCLMRSGAGFQDGYSVGNSPNVCLMRSGAGFQDGYTAGLSPEVCFFVGGPNDGYAAAAPFVDDFCDAFKIPLLSTPCALKDNGPYCNSFTGEQAALGEPIGQNWALDGIQHTLWFEFYPPSSGTFSIETINSNFDTQIAVYQVDTSTNCPACQLASAESGGLATNARLVLSCLDPAQKYYLQLDGNLGATGTTSIRITDVCPPAPYAGTDECNNNIANTHNTYNFCLTPNTTSASDPSPAAMTNILASSNTACGRSLDPNIENSTFLPIQFNSDQLQIDVTLNQSLCQRGFSVMLFEAPAPICPTAEQWGGPDYPLVACFEGNGLGNVAQLNGLNPNTVYYILVDGVQGDGGLIQLDISPTLPLLWLGFDGRCEGGKHELAWQTASEENCNYFEVQRSADAIHFEAIGQIPAQGGNYSFSVTSPPYGSNYYRLKQVDLSGNFSYSSLLEVSCGAAPQQGVALYPNPAVGYINLDIRMELPEGWCDAEIYDVLGRQLLRERLPNARTHTQRLSVANFSAAAYMLYLRDSSGRVVYRSKFIKKED